MKDQTERYELGSDIKESLALLGIECLLAMRRYSRKQTLAS